MSWTGYQFATNPITIDHERLRARLNERSNRIFSPESEIRLRVTDIPIDMSAGPDVKDCTVATEALRNLQKSRKGVKTRIISIFSEMTPLPLQITPNVTMKLIEEYDINPDFLCCFLSFGKEPDPAEGASSMVNVSLDETKVAVDQASNVMSGEQEMKIGPEYQGRSPDGDFEVFYHLRYMEENRRNKTTPWSRRHVAIFHKHKPDFDFYVILHCTDEPLFELRIQHWAKEEGRKNPAGLHSLALTTYMYNWNTYAQFLGSKFINANKEAMGMKPEEQIAEKTYGTLQTLRDYADRIHYGRACVSGNLDIIQAFKEADIKLSSRSYLQSQERMLKDMQESFESLQNRIRNLIEMMGFSLVVHNDLESAKVTNELNKATTSLEKLTRQSVDDNGTVKIVTIISAIYIPGSFVGTIFGMNFFEFNPVTRRIVIATDFWIFILTWIPLAVVTGLVFYLARVLWGKPGEGNENTPADKKGEWAERNGEKQKTVKTV